MRYFSYGTTEVGTGAGTGAKIRYKSGAGTGAKIRHKSGAGTTNLGSATLTASGTRKIIFLSILSKDFM